LSDLHSDAPAVVRAKELGIEYFNNFSDLFNKHEIDLVLEVTGVPAVTKEIEEIIRISGKSIDLMSAKVSKLFFDLMNKNKTDSEKIQNGVQSALQDVVLQIKEINSKVTTKTELISKETELLTENVKGLSNEMEIVSNASVKSEESITAINRSTDEMSITITEIAKNTVKARDVTKNAVKSVQSASVKVNELGISAKEISQVTETIAEIADQTKLLALNATIEAARAGEAGKGFAVVASEVKELAKQTNSATSDIRAKIASIQEATNGTISEINIITEVMIQVNEIVATIASAVEEQSITTKNVAKHITQVTDGIKEANSLVGKTSETSKLISGQMNAVNADHLDNIRELSLHLIDAVKAIELSRERLIGHF